MHRCALLVLIAASITMTISGQELSAGDKQIVDSARSKYYNLAGLGFESATCSVNFDFATVPQLPVEDREASYKLLRATRFTLKLEGKNPSVHYSYPIGTSEIAQQQASPLTNVLQSLAMGLFQTWITKGLQGPIPAFYSQVQSINATKDGYLMVLNVPGGPVQIEMDKDYLVKRIVSVGGKIDERPVYLPSLSGLIFTGNDVIDDSEQGGRVKIQYELENSIVDGFRLPSSIHLRVNQNIDVKFSLSNCAIEKGTVIVVNPPDVREQKQL